MTWSLPRDMAMALVAGQGIDVRPAGHSVEVLLRIYAKCLDGGDALIRQRVQAALGYDDTATDVSLSHVRP